MWVSVWLAMFAFAVLMTLIWAVFYIRFVVPMTSSLGAWAWLAYASETLQTHSGGVEFEMALPFMQWFSLFMTLITALGLVMWYLGDFPPEEAYGNDELDQDGAIS